MILPIARRQALNNQLRHHRYYPASSSISSLYSSVNDATTTITRNSYSHDSARSLTTTSCQIHSRRIHTRTWHKNGMNSISTNSRGIVTTPQRITTKNIANNDNRSSCESHWCSPSRLSLSSIHQRPFSSSSNAASQNDDKNNHQQKSSSLSVAIVGSGPSGFYTAKYLLSSLKDAVEEDMICDVDIIDRLPTPYGLVRSGVAPDHPEVKNVEHDFVSLLDDINVPSTTPTSSLNYMGNVTLGSKDISLQEILQYYDVVVLAYGCDSDTKLNLDGEHELDGIFSAREFVAWYNGHPDYVHLSESFSKLLSFSDNNKVVVIGQGNVALDCARVLAKGGKGLLHTDITRDAVNVLNEDNVVKKVVVMGRRGHVQGAFTIKELRELTKLHKEGHDAAFVVSNEELDMGTTEATIAELKAKGSRPKVRIDKLLRDAAKASSEQQQQEAEQSMDGNARKQVELRFLLNPKRFLPNEKDPSRVGKVLCERTMLQGEPGKQVAVGTGEMETIDADMVLVSIGYRGSSVQGLTHASFDQKRGIVKNIHGKVINDTTPHTEEEEENAVPEHGLYVSGWLKRGPTGIIGTNISDAKDTVSTILHDVKNGLIGTTAQKKEGREGLLHLLQKRNVQIVNWNDYQKIDKAEKDPKRLRVDDQPREKIVSVEEMLRIASSDNDA